MRKLDIAFKRENSHNILLVKREDDMGDNYREKMILKNSIEGIARTKLHHFNGEAYYNIDLSVCVSLKDHFGGRIMSYKEISALLKGLMQARRRLEEYLLSSDDLIISPEYIYWNPEKSTPLFIYLPKCGDERSAEELAQFLIEVSDQKDEDAVRISSDFFNMVCDGVLSLEELLEKREENPKEVKPAVEEKHYEADFGDSIRVVKKDHRAEMEARARARKEKTVKVGVSICVIFTLMAAGLYIYVLADPDILKLVGMNEDDYLLAGAIIAIVFSAAIMGTVHFYKKAVNDIDEEADIFASMEDDEEYESDYLKDAIQDMELKRENNFNIPSADNDDFDDEETVLLTETKSACRGLILRGKVNGEPLVFNVSSESFTIGKMPGKVQGLIDDSRISRMHACIRKNGNRYFISDLNSTNGTCLNSRKLEANENAEISDGDIVKFANITMRAEVTI